MLPVDELELVIPENEYYNSNTKEFISIPEQRLRLKHSLVSVSKWEAKWKVPFLSKKPKTREQSVDYIKLMTITQNVNPLVYDFLPDNVMAKIQEYIDDPMTATVIKTTIRLMPRLRFPATTTVSKGKSRSASLAILRLPMQMPQGIREPRAQTRSNLPPTRV